MCFLPLLNMERNFEAADDRRVNANAWTGAKKE